jgi:hypothetical protein
MQCLNPNLTILKQARPITLRYNLERQNKSCNNSENVLAH